MVKSAIQSLWKYKCDVVVFDNEVDSAFVNITERVIYQSIPCHVNFYYYYTNTNASSDENSKASQKATLFVDNEVAIPAGSKVYVSKGDYSQEFEYTGLTMTYDYHNEYGLAIIDRRI